MTPPPPRDDISDLNLKKSYVYLLYSEKANKFYLGWTTDLKRRLDEHHMGQTMSTKGKGPWSILYHETYFDTKRAKARERSLKRSPNMMNHFKKRALCSSTFLPKEIMGRKVAEVVG